MMRSPNLKPKTCLDPPLHLFASVQWPDTVHTYLLILQPFSRGGLIKVIYQNQCPIGDIPKPMPPSYMWYTKTSALQVIYKNQCTIGNIPKPVHYRWYTKTSAPFLPKMLASRMCPNMTYEEDWNSKKGKPQSASPAGLGDLKNCLTC